MCSFPNSWDSLVVAIGSNATTLKFDDVVSSLLSEEMRRKTMDSQSMDSLSVRGHTLDRNKNKSSSGRSKSRGRSKSPGCSFHRRESSSEEGGDVYLASSTHANHDVWLINSGDSFHMTPHREWFCEYERYNGGDIFLGDDSTTKNHRTHKGQVVTQGWKD
jgi:hypothetical protein